MDLKALKKNGEEFYVEVGLGPVQVEENTFIMAVVSDISKRRIAEKALGESHRRLNSLIDNIPGIVYRCANKEDWPMEFISPACKEITGYSSEDFYGNPSKISFGKLMHEDDAEDIWEQVQLALSTRSPYRTIYRIVDRKKREKWLWEQGIGVFNKKGDLLFLEGCIFDISPIVKNQERVKSAIYTAEDSERKRIAAALHDGLQQTLSIVALHLQSIQMVPEPSTKMLERLSKAEAFLDKGIKETRQIAHSLMPRIIHEVGLSEALETLATEIHSIGKVQCSYFSNLTERLEEEVEVGLYRISQEIINNIIKHAKASNITIQLIRTNHQVQLMIEDDGVGFDKNKLNLYKAGYGLTGMKNRMSSLSGNLLIDAKPGHGTSIIARVTVR